MRFVQATPDLGRLASCTIKGADVAYYRAPRSLVPDVDQFFALMGEHIVISEDVPEEMIRMLVNYLDDVRTLERSVESVKYWHIPLARAIATYVDREQMGECVALLRDAYAQYRDYLERHDTLSAPLKEQLDLINAYLDRVL